MNRKKFSLSLYSLLLAITIISSNIFANSITIKGDTLNKYNVKSLNVREEAYIDSALKMMSMNRDSTGFKKDKVDDKYRLEKVQYSLYHPLDLPYQCDTIDMNWHDATGIADAFNIQAKQLGKWWNITDKVNLSNKSFNVNSITSKAPIELQPILNPLLIAINNSQILSDKAFETLSIDEKKYIVKKILLQILFKKDINKDDFQIDADKIWLKLVGKDSLPIIGARDTVYPEDEKIWELTLKIKYQYLNQAGIVLTTAVDDAIKALQSIDLSIVKTISSPNPANVSGEVLFYAETPLGLVIIGGKGDNVYKKDAILTIDIGGEDQYFNRAGGAIGVIKSVSSVLIDLNGNDIYSCDKKFSQGAAIFGIGILADLNGNDYYKGVHYCQGAGLFGIGILWDKNSTNDYFSGDNFCQGAGGWGIGILYDESGETNYYAHTFSQGLGLTLGIGALVDFKGNDNYIAAGTMQNNRYYCMSQGFGEGNRPMASGGIGMLIDFSGDDHYSAIFYAQGCSYWYGLGILIDDSGTDRYDAQVYAQGCGIHLSTGILIDRGGTDFYNCTYGGNAQGAAHDLSVGILIDKNGNDTYIGRGNNQGSAITNAFALFIDSEGDDVYYTLPKGGQGIGGEARGYGSIGVFLDLGGNDFYSEPTLNPDCGTGNNARWIKGNKGAGIDIDK